MACQQPKSAPTLEVKAFEVKKFDICLKENGAKHNTDDYKNGNFVIRKGGSFTLKVFHNGFDENVHKFFFELRTGDKPMKKNGTLIEILKEEQNDEEFSYQIKEKNSDHLVVNVFIPVHAVVAAYKVQLVSEMKVGGKKTTKGFPLENILYVIFNPWNKDDEVYMEDEELKKEYVLNDSGWVFWGGHKPKPWNFAQFSDAALKCSFKLLEQEKKMTNRDTAREVSRHISAVANACDGNGLLVGNWSGDYGNETKPWQWSGSQAIFKKYLETGKSVMYGQCWVFSGVTTSIMRCLGIPARSVTNYDSAHDADGNCTDDKYFDEDLNYLEDESYDSVWNFHVWNDVWMARPDLPAGMGGWQAIDATPQEQSGGIFRCGPASIQAIKEGNIMLGHDTRFVFAEVNADTVYWQKTKDGECKPVKIKSTNIGTALLTKKANKNEMEDVIDQYKHKEGSALERAVIKNVMKKVKNPVLKDLPKDVTFAAKVPWNITPDGDLTVKLNATSKKFETLNITAALVAHVVRYTGVKLKTLEKRTADKKVESRGEGEFSFKFDMKEFEEFFDENISIRFSIMAKVKETGQSYITQKVCNVIKPDLKVELASHAGGKVTADDKLKVKIFMPKIPGVTKFTKAKLEVESSIVDNVTIDLKDAEVNAASGFVEKTFEIEKLEKDRVTDFNVTFNAAEVSGVHGSVELKYTAPQKVGGCKF